jgi:ribonucleoside-diphosphate reductase alpha chain
MTEENNNTNYPQPFRTQLGYDIFKQKYAHEGAQTWEELSHTLVEDVCKGKLSPERRKKLEGFIATMKFIPGGRYLYYAGRPNKFFNNCYLLRSLEDTREDWANLSWKAETCLMTGGGIGNDYSIYRPAGSIIKKTGGEASGVIPKMKMINEIGRNVMQGGSRRSAIYGSLNWRHGDINEFLHAKDWYNMPVSGAYDDNGKNLTIGLLKEKDFNYPAPLDMTNISLNYDNHFLETVYDMPIVEIKKAADKGESLPFKYIPSVFIENVRQALKTGEPGFSFNFFDKENETLRNACTEVTSEDDSDVCNLGSVNMSRIESLEEFKEVVELASEFLLCGTLKAKLPYKKVEEVREKNRRLGLGLMGVHEWLLKRGYNYNVNDELKQWLQVYKDHSETSANALAKTLKINQPVAYRAIAPTGTIGILAATSTGIEPLFAVAYKRRYLKGQHNWHFQYVVDGMAQTLIDTGIDPEAIESAVDLAGNPERRIKFQADIQDYVDMSISSTINITPWGTELNNETRVYKFAKTLLSYAHRIRGFTCYPDGARGGQPITSIPYNEAIAHEGKEFKEEFHDICDISGGGTCGV